MSGFNLTFEVLPDIQSGAILKFIGPKPFPPDMSDEPTNLRKHCSSLAIYSISVFNTYLSLIVLTGNKLGYLPNLSIQHSLVFSHSSHREYIVQLKPDYLFNLSIQHSLVFSHSSHREYIVQLKLDYLFKLSIQHSLVFAHSSHREYIVQLKAWLSIQTQYTTLTCLHS